MFIDMLQNSSETPLMPYVRFLFILVLNKTISLFIDRIIRQVHAKLTQIGAHRTLITFSSKPGQSLLVDVASQRIDASYQNVYPQIEFEPVNKVRFVQISLRYVVLSLDEPITVSGQENASTLALLFRFYDESLSSFVVELLLEIFRVSW